MGRYYAFYRPINMPATPTDLKLDPGPQPRRQSRFGCCKCILWAIITIVCLVSSYAGYAFLRGLTMWFKAPHSHLFQDLSVPYKPNEVVRPLVDTNQTFDIVATVWVRQDTLDLVLDGDNATHVPTLTEEVVYSGTIFQGLRLSDKNVRSTVNLNVPTEILCVYPETSNF